eukprot:2762967-Prymnesium_polylepis.1
MCEESRVSRGRCLEGTSGRGCEYERAYTLGVARREVPAAKRERSRLAGVKLVLGVGAGPPNRSPNGLLGSGVWGGAPAGSGAAPRRGAGLRPAEKN